MLDLAATRLLEASARSIGTGLWCADMLTGGHAGRLVTRIGDTARRACQVIPKMAEKAARTPESARRASGRARLLVVVTWPLVATVRFSGILPAGWDGGVIVAAVVVLLASSAFRDRLLAIQQQAIDRNTRKLEVLSQTLAAAYEAAGMPFPPRPGNVCGGTVVQLRPRAAAPEAGSACPE